MPKSLKIVRNTHCSLSRLSRRLLKMALNTSMSVVAGKIQVDGVGQADLTLEAYPVPASILTLMLFLWDREIWFGQLHPTWPV